MKQSMVEDLQEMLGQHESIDDLAGWVTTQLQLGRAQTDILHEMKDMVSNLKFCR